MSFRDNLQHLRATRNMTQEQLAMLLGVSRQSVTKWEAERSYPEMDKLLKICQIFGVSLDDLVQGDLTNVEPDPSLPTIPSGPPTDICGYEEHMVRYAKRFPTAISLFILGAAFSTGLEGVFSGNAGDAIPTVALFVCIAAGLLILIPTMSEHSNFMKAHPFVEDFYTREEKDRAAHQRGIGIAVGIAIILVGLCIVVFADGTSYATAGTGIFLALVAVGVWFIMHWSILGGRTDLSNYNREALDEAEAEDIKNAENLDPERRETLINSLGTRKKKLTNAVCSVIMLVATIIALIWLFSPMFTGGSWDDLGAGMFWLPWVIGGISCGIAAVIIGMIVKD